MVKIIQPSLTPKQLTFVIDAINYGVICMYQDIGLEDKISVKIKRNARLALMQTFRELGDDGYDVVVKHLMELGHKAKVKGLHPTPEEE